MTTACIVQARITSSRLPGKVMYPLNGEPVIRHVLRRALKIPVDAVICAVPDDPRSDVLVYEAEKLRILAFKGSEDDVLSRYWYAARIAKADVIMRITADCPLIDPVRCAEVLNALKDYDYCSNAYPRSCEKGFDCEAFTLEALHIAHSNAHKNYDREHVTPYMQRKLNITSVPGEYDPDVNYCIDTADDYLRIQKYLESLQSS